MVRISHPRVTSATHEQPAAKAFSASKTNGLERRAELTRGKPWQRVSLRELKLDLSSRILFYLMAGGLHLLSLVPDLILYPLGIVCGYLGHLIDRRRGKIGMRNLALAFPEIDERARRRILRASYINLGRSAAEYIRLGGSSTED